MASVVISGDTSGSVTLSAPAVSGSSTQTLVAATGTLAPLVRGTEQATTSGTFKDFTGIPSWVNRITVMFNGVSVSGTSNIRIQLGDSGGIETTGYTGTNGRVGNGGTAAFVLASGFDAGNTSAAADASSGTATICNVSGNIWICSTIIGTSNTAAIALTGGTKTLSNVLTQIRITTVNGTDTFDAGSINIMYE